MHGAQMLMEKPVVALTAAKIARELRKVERESKSGGTGATIIRLTGKPIERLVLAKEIGPEELQAANDISTAFMSIAGALMVRGQTWERIDRGQDTQEPAAVIDAQRRYRAFAAHWSMRRNGWGDRTLEIIIAAVIDERAWYLIDQDLSLRHGVAKLATIRGLRDYAVRAGWIKGRLGDKWRAEAGNTWRRH